MDPPKLLLVFPAQSYRLDAFLQAAERARVALILATDLPAPFRRYGWPTFDVDFADPEASADAIVTASASRDLRGVLGTNESSAVMAALVAQRVGLPHHSAAGAMAARDKRRMRALLDAAGIPGPRVRIVDPDEPSDQVSRDVRFPCVVKPPMLTGSQGVIRANDPAELASAIVRVRAILARHPTTLAALPEFHRLLVEDYLPGREVSVEALATRGKVEALAIFDKPDALTGPFFEETLYVTPSRLDARAQERALTRTAEAAHALGLTHGPLHAELRVDGSDARIIEIAARAIGGLCSQTLALGLEDLLVAHSIGRAAPPSPMQGAAGVMMIPIPRSGVLRQVTGVEAARAVAGVTGVTISIAPGEAIRALPEGSSYLGFVFARGATPEVVEGALRSAHAHLHFDLAPLLDIAR